MGGRTATKDSTKAHLHPLGSHFRTGVDHVPPPLAPQMRPEAKLCTPPATNQAPKPTNMIQKMRQSGAIEGPQKAAETEKNKSQLDGPDL